MYIRYVKALKLVYKSKRDHIEVMAKAISKPTCINRNMISIRGKYKMFNIEIDLKKPLILQFKLQRLLLN